MTANRSRTLALVERWRALEARTRAASAKAGPLFDKRGQLLPRERVARLLDPGVPFLELSTLAGWLQDSDDPERSLPGGGSIVGIGVVAGVRLMVVADDAGIDAGAMQSQGLEKMMRAQQIALENRLPFIHLVESAGANLLKYRVEQFVRGCDVVRGLHRHAREALQPALGESHQRASRSQFDEARDAGGGESLHLEIPADRRGELPDQQIDEGRATGDD